MVDCVNSLCFPSDMKLLKKKERIQWTTHTHSFTAHCREQAPALVEWLSISLLTDGFLLQFHVRQCQAGQIKRRVLQTVPVAKRRLMNSAGPGAVSQAVRKADYFLISFYDYFSFFFTQPATPLINKKQQIDGVGKHSNS